MSRRDSRVHIAVRQNDALQEFETFKKKFLFANKQITKQNSNLSLKIEELNAHISTLYVENLRLRASEIALASQLRREKERSQRIMADAEAATLRLLEQLGDIRHSYKIQPRQSSSPDSPPTPPPPRAQRRVRSPSAPRLAQQPSIPGISEDPEPRESSSDERDHKYSVHADVQSSGSAFVTKAKPRHSGSRLPIPSRVSSPPPTGPIQHVDLTSEAMQGKKKLSRRPSGLMTFNDSEPRTRPPTPNFGAQIDVVGDEPSEDEREDEDARPVYTDSEKETELKKENGDAEDVKKKRKVKKMRSIGGECDELTAFADEKKEKKRSKEREILHAHRLKDVTNSPRRRRASLMTDSASEVERLRKTQEYAHSASPPPTSSNAHEEISYLPTPLPSSANTTPAPHLISLPTSESELGAVGGRERRTRKSVNYAEPKLNTKMRKPDITASSRASLAPATTESQDVPSSQPSRRRSFDSHEPSSTGSARTLQEDGQTQLNPDLQMRSARTASTTARRKIQLHEQLHDPNVNTSDASGDDAYDDEDGADADADAEYAPTGRSSWSNVAVSRRRSAALVAAGKLGAEVGDRRRRSAAA